MSELYDADKGRATAALATVFASIRPSAGFLMVDPVRLFCVPFSGALHSPAAALHSPAAALHSLLQRCKPFCNISLPAVATSYCNAFLNLLFSSLASTYWCCDTLKVSLQLNNEKCQWLDAVAAHASCKASNALDAKMSLAAGLLASSPLHRWYGALPSLAANHELCHHTASQPGTQLGFLATVFYCLRIGSDPTPAISMTIQNVYFVP
jgi:hypothetical protein